MDSRYIFTQINSKSIQNQSKYTRDNNKSKMKKRAQATFGKNDPPS